MKVSFILPSGGRAGGIKVTIMAGNSLVRRGHDVRFLISTSYGGFKYQMLKMWLKLCYPQGNNWENFSEGKLERFSDIHQCKFTKREIVVAAGWWAARQMRMLNNDSIVKVHYVHSKLKNSALMFEMWGEKVPKIIVASYLEELIKDTCNQGVVDIIPNSIDTKEYYPSAQDDMRDGVGMVFGKSFDKDPETALEVLSMLSVECPEVPQRVFSTRRRPRKIPARSYWRLPSVAEARDIYSRSLVWIVASRSEGFGIPILEAMACGCAVVATDCGGPRDIIVDGENGFLVEVGNAESIVEKVKVLLSDSELRRRFVNKSRETLAHFSVCNSADKLERVLQGLLKDKQEETLSNF